MGATSAALTVPATTPVAPAAPAAVAGGGDSAAPTTTAPATIQSVLFQLSQAVQAISALIASQTGATGGGAIKQAYVGQTSVNPMATRAGGGPAPVPVAIEQNLSIPATGHFEARITNGVNTYFSPQGSQITGFQYADDTPLADKQQQLARLVEAAKQDAHTTGSINPVDMQKLSFYGASDAGIASIMNVAPGVQ